MKCQILISVFAFFILLLNAGCSKNSVTLTPTQAMTQRLTAVPHWKAQSVAVDGVIQTTQFSNFRLSFTGDSFSTTDGSPLWPATGTWTFDDASAQSFTRNDGIKVAISEVSSTNLKLTITWTETTYSGAKVNSVAGNYVFSLTN